MDSDERHAIFTHELRSALRLTVGFSNIYCEPQQICRLCVPNSSFKHLIRTQIKLIVSYFFFLYYHSQCCCICRSKQFCLGNLSELDMCVYENFFPPQPQILSPPEILPFSPESLCINNPCYPRPSTACRDHFEIHARELWGFVGSRG